MMRGYAFKWIQPHLKEFLEKNKDEEELFTNFNKFYNWICLTFKTINDKEYMIYIIKIL